VAAPLKLRHPILPVEPNLDDVASTVPGGANIRSRRIPPAESGIKIFMFLRKLLRRFPTGYPHGIDPPREDAVIGDIQPHPER
jgi:hypothetical protein